MSRLHEIADRPRGSALHFRILGPLEILDGDLRPVELDSARLRALVCRLLIDRGNVVSPDGIIDGLWGDDPPAGASGTVQTYVTRLRRVIEPERLARSAGRLLVTRPSGYALAVEHGHLDADLFVDRVGTVERALIEGEPGRAVEISAEAVALWRGRPFDDVADLPFASAAVARFEQMHAHLLERRAEALIAAGQVQTAIAELEQHVRLHPLNERFWAIRMTALYRAGRQAEALRAYANLREVLADEVGLQPSPELQRLERAILDHTLADDAGSIQLDRRPPAMSLWAAPVSADASGSGSDVGPERVFVGRASELQLVESAIDRAERGRGAVITVDGEAGIGKSRLVEVAVQRAAERGVTVAWSQCLDEIGAPPLWPWTQIRDQVVMAPAPEGRLSTPSHGASDDAERALFELLTLIVDELLAAARQRPLVAVIDDLQWADRASLQMLRLLSARVGDAALLVVATIRRPEPSSHPFLEATLADLVRSPTSHRLRLAGLDQAESRQLVERIVGDRTAHADALHERTGGNPFFLSESARLLAAGGRAAATAAGPAELLPDTVRDVVARRVAVLPDDTQTLLRLTAVAGQRIELAVLQDATGLDAEAAINALEPAVAAGLLVELDETIGWRFDHALAQDAVRAGIARATRARLHATLAASIERVHAFELDAHLDELAHHTFEGVPINPADIARSWSVAAATAARRRHGFDRAVFHWQRALALLPTNDAHRIDRYELLLSLAEDQRLLGDPETARVWLVEAIAIARALGDDERAARAVVVFGGVTLWYWRPYGEVEWEMVAEVERLAQISTGTRQAELLGTLGVELYYSDRRPDGMRAATRSVELARQSGDVALLGRALNSFVLAHWEPGPDHLRPAALEEAIGLVGRGLPLHTEVIARVHRAANRLRAGDVAGFEADLDLCRGLAAELAVPEIRAQLTYAQGGLAMLRGKWPDAERLAGEAFEVQSRTSVWGAEWARVMQMVPILIAQERVGEFVDEALRIAEIPGMDATWPLTSLAVAEAGDEPLARRLVERWWRAGGQADWTTDHQLADWAWLATRLGVPDPATVYASLLPYADRMLVAGTAVACRGSMRLELGALAATIGDLDAARTHFELAVERNTTVGAPAYAAEAARRRAALG